MNEVYHKIYYKRNSKKLSKASSDWRKRQATSDPRSYLLTKIRNRAKAKGLDFNLEVDDLEIPQVCPILNVELVPLGTRHIYAPSVDRVDNTKGYVKGNVKIISLKANRMKSDMSKEDIERLYLYTR